jgi:hypothetical protein
MHMCTKQCAKRSGSKVREGKSRQTAIRSGASGEFCLIMLSETNSVRSSPSEENKSAILYLDRLEVYKTEKPCQCSIDPWHVPDAKPTNRVTRAYAVEIHDIPSKSPRFTTDVHGFEFFKHSTCVPLESFKQDEEVPSSYLSKCEALLKDHFDAFRVHIFNHTVCAS